MGALAVPFPRDLWRGLQTGAIGPDDTDLADGVLAFARALHQTGERSRPEPARGPAGAHQGPHIEEHLSEPDLGPPSIARAQFVSTRYLHKLFAGEPLSISEWIRCRRLERCRRDLADPALSHETIAAIAARWGMTNHAAFSRSFREAYGCAPRDVRP